MSPKRPDASPKKRYAIGTEVRVRLPGVNGIVTQLDSSPTVLGEYWHTVRTEFGDRREPGSNLELLPAPVTNKRPQKLRTASSPAGLLSPDQAISLMRTQLDERPEDLSHDDPEVESWERVTLRIVERAFGEHSRNANHFVTTLSYARQSDAEKQAWHVNHIKDKKGLLRAFIKELEIIPPYQALAEDEQFARMAVEEARKSQAEDSREHPRVGCVVVRNGKIIAAAHRGELAGNHAEFVALETKLRDETLAGCTVYTTLEPCTTRNHPKIPCADRLIERKVARVVIGTLDPNPDIRGRGMWKLQQANIAVEMFPHPLALELIELNRHFFRSFAGPGEGGRRKLREPVPNVCSLRPETAMASYDPQCDVWSKGSTGFNFLAAVLPFTNEPRQSMLTAPIDGLRARLTYYEEGRVEEFRRIDSGCWLNEAYRSTELRVGDIAYLVAAIQNSDLAATISNPRYSVARYSEDRTDAIPLPPGSYELKVDLFGGDHGEYAESYWYKLDVGEQLKATRINQRPVISP